MAGFIGGGGLGTVAVNYGYNRYNFEIMLVAVIIIVIVVQIFQVCGMWLARHPGQAQPLIPLLCYQKI